MNPSTLYRRACDEFDGRVQAIRPDQWDAATPCSEWTVRDLVNHVTVEELWVPPLLAGKTLEEVGDAFDGDQLGSDPIASWTGAVSAAKAAAADPAVETRTVHISYGEESAGEYLMQIFWDRLIHSWDLATAIGADPRLPEDLVEACAAWWADRRPMFDEMGVIGPDREIGNEVPAPDEADAQTRLLAAVGRRATS